MTNASEDDFDHTESEHTFVVGSTGLLEANESISDSKGYDAARSVSGPHAPSCAEVADHRGPFFTARD